MFTLWSGSSIWATVKSRRTWQAGKKRMSSCLVIKSSYRACLRQHCPSRAKMAYERKWFYIMREEIKVGWLKCTAPLPKGCNCKNLYCRFKISFYVLTSWAGRGLLSGWRGTHCSSQADHAVSCSRSRAVSASFTGHFISWANRTAVASRTEVTMGAVGWRGTGTSTQTNIPVGVNKDDTLHIKIYDNWKHVYTVREEVSIQCDAWEWLSSLATHFKWL